VDTTALQEWQSLAARSRHEVADLANAVITVLQVGSPNGANYYHLADWRFGHGCSRELFNGLIWMPWSWYSNT
jgi:hypothetical protein